MPFLAILRFDLRTLMGSWLVRLWLAASVLLTLVIMLSCWKDVPSGQFLAYLLMPYLVFPWPLAVIVLGVDPVSGARIEALADGILSRPVTRYEYLVASWLARVVMVLAVCLVVVLPASCIVYFATKRPAADDSLTAYGLIASLGVVGLVLTLQVTLAFCLGSLLRRPLVAVLVLLFIWYPVDLVLDQFSLEEFSPTSLNRALPTLLRTPWSPTDEAKKDAPAVDAATIQAVMNWTPVLSTPRKETFFDKGHYEDFSLWRVVLAYGTATLLAAGLATWNFSLRDL